MKFDDENRKRYAAAAALIAFGVVLLAALMNLGAVLGAVKTLIGFFLPLIAGLVIAFILDVPARALERLIGRVFPKAAGNASGRKAAVIGTLLALAGIITLIAVTVNPVVAASARSAADVIRERFPAVQQMLTEKIPALGVFLGESGDVGDALAAMFSEGIPDGLSANAHQAVSAVAGKAADTVSFLMTLGIGCIIAVYVLFDKTTVLRHADKLITAAFPPKAAGRIRRICGMVNATYSKFLSGQCIEALILGVMMAAVLLIFRIPYAVLIAVLVTVLSFIPYLGAFLAVAIGALLTFITAPEKLVLFLILYFAVQFVEEQFIYPHVVGSSVGLSPLLTLLSVIIGGSTFGLLGVLFFIPLVSVLYELVKEWADRRLP